MNKTHYLLAAVLAVAACTQKTEIIPVEDSGLVSLEVSVPQIQTKVASGDNDATVGAFQVFVFRDDGTYEAGAYGSAEQQTVKVSQGAKTIAVLANHSEITENLSLSALQAKSVDLSENAVSSILMFGTKDVNVSADASVEVEVTRLVSKIEIVGITNAIEMDQYKDLTMTVNAIYLINVVGGRTLTGALDSPTWYNQMENKSEQTALLYDALNQTVANGTTSTVSRHFYCFPNSAAETSDETWSPRPTRLVVEIQLGTETWYYPITVLNVEANKHYIISGLTITRIGTDNPDEEMTFNNLDFTLTVKDWDEQSITEVTI